MSRRTRSTPAHVLLVEDQEELAAPLVESLRPLGFDVCWKTSVDAALAVLDEVEWDVVVTGIDLTGIGGLALCELVAAHHRHLPVIIVSAGSVEMAVGAIRAGAYDLVPRPFTTEGLVLALERAVEHHRLHAEVTRLREMAVSPTAGMIGTSPAMRPIFDLIARVADTDITVLVTGPSGTGKELVARALHDRGRRKSGPFVAVNCAAIPEPLLESELFGHRKGAFTDARLDRRGLFLKASGGTLFLDEIADMPLGMQSKLLRVLQEKTVRAVGGDREEPYDARIVAATNRDIEAEVAQQRFREDLFYRLNVIRADLPPLAARDPDILLLAQHFLARASARLTSPTVRGLTDAAAAMLLAYDWPGNVRELENCIERAVVLAGGDWITVDDLPENIRHYEIGTESFESVDPAIELLTLDEVQRRHILCVLKSVGGNKAAAAAVLGVHQSTLYRKVDRYSGRGRKQPRTTPAEWRAAPSTAGPAHARLA